MSASSNANERSAEAGFSLVELLIGLAVTIAIAVATLGVVHSFTNSLSSSYASMNGVAAIDQRIADMRNDSATALSVFVPTLDIHGQQNAALGQVGHEVDFYSKNNGTNVPIYWAYYFNSKAETLQRFDYDESGNVGVRNATTGNVDTSAAYPPISNVTSFTAQGMMASDLATGTNPYANTFTQNAKFRITDLPVSLNNDKVNRPDNFAGNTVVQVHVQAKNADRYVHLAAGAFPTGFTTVSGPAYHAILWRQDNTVKRLFGTVSRVFIYADVDVTYDNWKHYQIWCHAIPIYGAPGGLRKGDPREDYGAGDPGESANRILEDCRDGIAKPGDNGYYPPHPNEPLPDPNASSYPTAAPGSY